MSTEHSADENHPILGIPWTRMPRHIAIIMDGNGRWAQQRGQPRLVGHRNGSKAVRSVITESARLGIECLTLYSFSTENWKRPQDEIAGLMQLYADYLIAERPTIMKHSIRVRHLGDAEGLPGFVRKELNTTIELSAGNTGMVLCLALNYSGRSELIGAVENIVTDAKAGKITEAVTEELVNSYLDTAGLPDPDLLIRTAGEKRISNFLLWQIAYAELYVTDVFWPDFDHDVLYAAINEYATRHRRFGGLKPAGF